MNNPGEPSGGPSFPPIGPGPVPPGYGPPYGPPPAPQAPVTVMPAPPAGPGVRPPFVAPPTDGNRKRLWTGLVTAGVIAVVLCGGGVAGFAALVTSTVDARRTAATKAVTEFLTDLQHDNYAGAYEAQCDELKQRLTFRAFTDDVLELAAHFVPAAGAGDRHGLDDRAGPADVHRRDAESRPHRGRPGFRRHLPSVWRRIAARSGRTHQ